jgi:rhomboid protease GluP
MTSASTFGRRATPPAATTFARPAPAPVQAASLDAATTDKTPYLTIGLATLLALIFIFEQTGGLPMGAGMDLHLFSLIASGGMSRDLVFEQGEWWRIFTAPLLHGSLSHIVGNVVVMLFAAITLERLMGRAWLAATFVVSALGGAVGSLLMNPHQTVTVGASGAIMGLLAMVLASSLHYASHENAKRLRWVAYRLMIPSLIPYAGSSTDYNGHLGGAVAGGLMGFALLVAWPEDEERPRLSRLMAVLGWTGLAAAVAAFALVATRHGTYIDRGRPLAAALPDKGWADAAQVRDLTARYPHDPRVRLHSAHLYTEARNYIAAERELRLGLAETEILDRDLPPAVRQTLRYFLVASLLQQQREIDARREAAPLCAEPLLVPSLEKAEKALRRGFCPA